MITDDMKEVFSGLQQIFRDGLLSITVKNATISLTKKDFSFRVK